MDHQLDYFLIDQIIRQCEDLKKLKIRNKIKFTRRERDLLENIGAQLMDKVAEIEVIENALLERPVSPHNRH